jgi:hypothetical protein
MADAITVDTSQIDNWRRKIDGAPAVVQQAMRDATVETAAYSERLIIRNGRSKGISQRGGSLWLSGVGSKGAPIDAKADIAPDGMSFTLRAIGPWQFVEGDTRPHAMPGSRRRTKKDRRGRPLPYRTPYGARSKVMHPGTRGKRIWRQSYGELRRRYPRVYRDLTFKALQRLKTGG